ncbi:MAG: hypothetical protein F6K00_16105 [Leptolyngbya sp. SIOISBB]|nr:hypothetical protein [Leptolyngbya sp. SIOISBB]
MTGPLMRSQAADTNASHLQPLGASQGLGTTVISPKLIAPLGAQSLTVLQPFPNAHWVATGSEVPIQESTASTPQTTAEASPPPPPVPCLAPRPTRQ